MSHAHGREGSGGHSKLSWVDEQGLSSIQGVKELLPMEARQSQALQVTSTELWRAFSLYHEGGKGLFTQPSAFCLHSLRVLFPPALQFFFF